MIRGKFIVLEGLEGAGKSTAHQAILAQLSELGINDVVLTREPGGTPLAEKLRHLIKHDLEEPICDKAELLMLLCGTCSVGRKCDQTSSCRRKMGAG